MDSQTPTLTFDKATLTPVVRRALGSATVEVLTWDACPLGGAFSPVTGGLVRIDGTISDRGGPMRWSLILKVCRDTGNAADADPRSSYYWRREYLAYASGLLDDLPPGACAPRCFGAEERPDGTAWLWLEDLTDRYLSPWPLERYGLAARHVGMFNGAYLCGRPLPAEPWLSADQARGAVEQFGRPIERLPEFADHPLVRCQWPDAGITDRIVRVWRGREAFLAALARLPKTLCHLDYHRRNLFAVRGPDGSDETVAIDWAFLGTAAIGEELATLVCASVMTADADPDRVRELGETCFDGYLAGLRDAGWAGDASLARLGYAAGAIRYGLLALAILGAIDPAFAARAERSFRRPYEELMDRTAAVQRYTLDLADEARELMAITSS